MEHWRQVVFSSVEIWWNVEHKYGETRTWQVCHRWWYGLRHRRRIGPFSEIPFIPEQSEWPIAKDAEPFYRRFNARHWQTFYDLVNVYVFDSGSICIHGKELLRQFTFHQKYRGNSHFKADVRDIWTVDIDNRMWFLECLKSAGKVLHGNSYLWSMMKKSSVSRMQRFTYSQILCYVLEKWSRYQYQILFGSDSLNGSKIHHNTELWTRSTENRWNSSGIFSQDSLHWSLSVKSKSSWAKLANPKNSKDELSSCRCSVTSHGERKTMKRNVLPMPHMCLFSQKDFEQDVGHSSDLGQKQSGIPLTKKDQEENGIESLESIVSKNAQKQRKWKIICTLLWRWRYDWNCFSHNHFCQSAQYLRSSLGFLWRIQYLSIKHGETCWGKTIRPTLHLHLRLRFLHKKIYCRSTKERVEKLPQPDQLIKICTDAGLMKTREVGQYFMTKQTDEFLQFADSMTCREYPLPRDDQSTDPKGWIQGSTKIGPVLEVTTSYI